MQLQNPAHRNFQIVWMETQDFYCFRQLQQPSTRFGSRIGKTWRAWHRVGIKGSWLVNKDSISWYQEAKISKVSIFHEPLRYDNFKIISPGDRYLPVYVKLLTLINEKKKKKPPKTFACFKLRHYTQTWKIIKICTDLVNVNVVLNFQTYKEN